MHPIDGDGLVCAISFAGDGRAHFQSRFVSTAHRAHEQREHRLIYRGQVGNLCLACHSCCKSRLHPSFALYRGQMGTLSGHWLREAAALAWRSVAWPSAVAVPLSRHNAALVCACSVLRCRGLEFKMRNPSNTNVFYWEGARCRCCDSRSFSAWLSHALSAGKLLSCYETSLPYSLDPFTLQTIGPSNALLPSVPLP